MRDMTMVKDALGHTAHRDLSAAPIPHLSPVEEQEALSKLLHALQMSLDPDELLALFFKHVQPLIILDGMRFIYATPREESILGRKCAHHCDYRLNLQDGYLGEIIFSRSKRFVEEELAKLEKLLGSLIYPLRNALRYQKAMTLALQDPLTGLGNRTALDKALYREVQLAERYEQELSLLMIDIDHFKKINDNYGHSRGDQVLCEVAAKIQAVCRESDITFRYGGEEFVVLLRKTGLTGALVIAERLRGEIARLEIHDVARRIVTTVSIGVGTRTLSQREQSNDLFEQADKALYYAKAAGRNCIMNLPIAS